MKRHLLVLCVVPLLLTVLVGCAKSPDNTGVASAPRSGGPSAGASLDRLDQERKWSECMRAHGVQVTDPFVEDGDVHPGTVDDGEIDKNKVNQAEDACRQYATGRDAGPPQAVRVAQALEFARCMRAHGVPNFPDPDGDGRTAISDSVRNNPRYAAAKETCNAAVPKAK
jgi:hypothetical protein